MEEKKETQGRVKEDRREENRERRVNEGKSVDVKGAIGGEGKGFVGS